MGNRSTDGVTVTKVLLGTIAGLITLFLGVITYVYTTNVSQTEKNFTEFGNGMKEIASEVRQIREQGITLYSHVQNNDSRIARVELENREFRKETRTYWGQNK